MSRIDQRSNAPKSEAHRMAQDAWVEKQQAKKTRVEANQEARAKRTPQQQLEHLDAKLGVGVGAVKERARLFKQVEKVNAEANKDS